MDLQLIKKGLFSLKEPVKKVVEIKAPNETAPNGLLSNNKITYSEFGFIQAGKLGGTVAGLRVSLQKIYYDFKQCVKEDCARQEEFKKPYRIKIEDYKGDNERLGKKIEKYRTIDIPNSKQKIDNLKVELSHIKQNPHEITGDNAGTTSLIIGGIILFFLTLYLFIFYSSASYSTFFKQFTLNEIGVANSIFDAKALTKALADGLPELLLILTIPFVFLGLGYLIHKFQQQKGFKKYIKISILILVTFVFYAILAYKNCF